MPFKLTFESEHGVLTSISMLADVGTTEYYKILIMGDNRVLSSQYFHENLPRHHAELLAAYLKSFEQRSLDMNSIGFQTIGYDVYAHENIVVKHWLSETASEWIQALWIGNDSMRVEKSHGFHDSLKDFTLKILKSHFEILPSKLRDLLINVDFGKGKPT